MRLADDRRGRVPFAVIGVVLLVGSATFAATVDRREPRPTDPDVVEARERLEAAVDTAVRRASAEAAARAAAEPVVAPARSPAGETLGTHPFRRYLEARVYLSVRRALSELSVSVGAVEGSATLARPSGLDSMTGRVEVTRGVENASLDVRVENVTLRLTRRGRTVSRRNLTVERTVASPVLAIHDRVVRFRQRLNAGLTDASGLAARAAAVLYAIAWSRGAMQFGGAPIENVLANRHLAVATNFALLGIQRSVFGRADPAGVAAFQGALAVAMAQDAGMGAANGGARYLEKVIAVHRNGDVPQVSFPDVVHGPVDGPSADDNVTVGVNATADRALAAYLNGSGTARTLGDVLRTTYSARVRYRTATTVVDGAERPDRNPPGPDWTLVNERTVEEVTVADGDGPLPPSTDRWHRLASYTRRVNVTRTVYRRWRKGNRTRVNRRTYSRTKAVGVVLEGLHSPTGWLPRGTIRSVHRRGAGPLDGPNLAGVPAAARDRFLDGPGRDTMAKRAALGDLDTDPRTVEGTRPAGLRTFVRPDVVDVYRRIRNVTASVERGAVGAGTANAAERLLQKLERRRDVLVDAPATYDSVAHKARVAARAAYVDEVIARLEARAERTAERNAAIGEVLSSFGVSLRELRLAMQAEPWQTRRGRPLFADGIAGPVNVTVAGSPPYLTRAPLSHSDASAVAPETEFYPLRTRNVNLFSLPYGEAGDTVISAVMGGSGGTDLRTAAIALRSANRTLARRDNRSLERKRDRLRTALSAALRRARVRLFRTLGTVQRRYVPGELSSDERNAIVREALAEWDTTAARTLALANGSLARAVTGALAARTELTPANRTLATLQFGRTLDRLAERSAVRPPRALVNETSRGVRDVARHAAGEVTERAFNESFERIKQRYDDTYELVPAGLPISPVPAFYYAVANVWINDVRGTYASFAVSAQTGSPVGPAAVTYRLDGRPVALDVDADGERELLGWSRRVSFEFVVPVLVVVPPTPTGLGDRNGVADEQSPGWSNPPPVRRRANTSRGDNHL